MDKTLGLFSARGRLIIEVMQKPGITINELATKLYLTKRTVWGIIGELRSMDYLRVVKKGRTHHYYISNTALSELRKLRLDRGAEW